MSEIIGFTDNIRDLSNENGFQFEFVCERCGNGYRSPFQNNVMEKGRGLLRGAGSLFGGRLQNCRTPPSKALYLAEDKLGRWSLAVRTLPVVRWARSVFSARVVHDDAWKGGIAAALR